MFLNKFINHLKPIMKYYVFKIPPLIGALELISGGSKVFHHIHAVFLLISISLFSSFVFIFQQPIYFFYPNAYSNPNYSICYNLPTIKCYKLSFKVLVKLSFPLQLYLVTSLKSA